MQGQIKFGRVIDRSINRAERSVENRIQNKIDKKVDKTLDTVEDSIFNSKPDNKKSTVEKKSSEKSASKKIIEKSNEPAIEETPSAPAPTLTWAKYDFIPGTEILFEDHFDGEQNGEFPSKWDLVGGVAENAVFDNTNVIYFRETGNKGGIVPLLKNSKSDYLPEEFTIEFDSYFDKDIYNQRYYVNFYDLKNQKSVLERLVFYVNQATYGPSNMNGAYPGAERINIDKQVHWRHIAISFNKRALKIYMDDARILNIPNIDENPTGFTIGTTSQQGKNYFIKNVRIAKGAVPLYDKFLTDGKFITTGIKFDINKATIKPESMGTINYVVKMMTDHPELSFSVEGHTDSDGEAIANQKLSEARAKAVLNVMIKLGIDQSRLISTGHGESKPMTGNDSPEGKAQNRRVEFVKQ
jgi:outer membrane protein OmpA-like peptidoglycan-associated protein